MGIDVGEAKHGGGQRALGVKPPLGFDAVDPSNIEPPYLGGFLRRGSALEPNERRRGVEQAVHCLGGNPEGCGQRGHLRAHVSRQLTWTNKK